MQVRKLVEAARFTTFDRERGARNVPEETVHQSGFIGSTVDIRRRTRGARLLGEKHGIGSRFFGNRRASSPKAQHPIERLFFFSRPVVQVTRFDVQRNYVQLNVVGFARLQDALERLTKAINDVETELTAMKAEHDPLASHIFVSRRHYQNLSDTKSGKRRGMNARLSFDTACELGFRGSLHEWERLMGAVARR
jgi:hypothetical protein